jgi:hypothetical protein
VSLQRSDATKTRDASYLRSHAYQVPNLHYGELFHNQATLPRQDATASAGWLIPDERSKHCKPVFIAHSTVSAIWLLRETLPEDTLREEGWQKLVYAAVLLADEVDDTPPSAQKTTTDSHPLDKVPCTLKRKAVQTIPDAQA